MNKKIIAILICGAMALSLTACGGASKVEQPDEVDAEGTDLFKGFIALTDEIGTMTYEEADEHVNSLGYPVSVENEETGGIITGNDEDGFRLTVNTYENKSGKEKTVCSISYNCNDVYEVSADDYFHDHDTPVYSTYNANASTPQQTVDSVDDLITFVNDEVPELIAVYGDPNAEAEEDATEEEETTEEEEPQTTEQAVSPVEIDPAVVACFADLADSVGEMTYNEAIKYMEDSGLDYDAVDPSADALTTITTPDDENGCHLYIFVYPDDDDVNIVSSVSYGNDHFSGSAGDNTHMDKVTYKTYNIYNDDKSTEVDSLQDVIDYINNEMPTLIAEDNAQPAGEPIDVTMDATEETTSNGTYFTIETNLPDGMSLMLTLTGSNNFKAQDHVTVKNGKAASSAFSGKNSAALKGDYELEVTSGLATTQSDDVQSIIGIDGENLTGEYVETNDSGKSMVDATFNFTF